MSRLNPALPTRRPVLGLWTVSAPVPPPPAEVVAAVVMFGDVVQEHDDGTTTIRLSQARVERGDLDAVLGADLARATEIGVIWDEREEQIVRVLDSGGLAPVSSLRGQNRYATARMRGGVAQHGGGPRGEPGVEDVAA